MTNPTDLIAALKRTHHSTEDPKGLSYTQA